MTIRDLVKMEIDIDVYDNVCEELGIAFCGPMIITEEGEKEFADVLDYTIEIINDHLVDESSVAIVDIDCAEWEKKLKRAKKFFYSIAGYVDDELFKKWFKFDDEE